MGATRNTGYIENLIAYDGNNNIGVGGPVNVLYKVTIGGNTLVSGNLNVTGTITFSSNVTANSFVKNGGVATEFLKADGTVDTSTYATVSYVDTSISNLIDAAPAALNTLNELAAALGDDSSFSTTVTTALGNRLRIDTDAQGLTSEQKANGRTNLGVVIGTDVQAYDADLGAIAALTGTSGFLKKTAANTWSLDTTAVTGTGTINYIPKFTATGSTIGNSSLYYSESANANIYTFGSVGAGAIYNLSQFNIYSNATSEAYFQWGSNKYLYIGNSGGNVSISSINTGTHVYNNLIYYNGASADNRYLSLGTEGLNRVIIKQTGQVLLSATQFHNAFEAGLLVGPLSAGDNTVLEVRSGAGGQSSVYLTHGTSASQYNADVEIFNSGNFGIVVYNPGVVSSNYVLYYDAESTSNRYLAFQTEGSDRITINGNGTIKMNAYTTNGFVKFSGSNGTLSVDTNTYLTAESDTLQSVISRGATTNTGFTISNANDTYSTPASTNVPYIYLYNTGTTGTSNAVLSLRTNSGTGGDPILSFDIGGVQGWSMGIDNSDSDKFKIAQTWNALDSSTRFSMQTDGTANFTGNLTAANLSGTNTGDQDLSGYVTLAGTQTISGAKTFSGAVNIYNTDANDLRLYYQGAGSGSARVYYHQPTNELRIYATSASPEGTTSIGSLKLYIGNVYRTVLHDNNYGSYAWDRGPAELASTNLNDMTTTGYYWSGASYGTNSNIPYANYFTMINMIGGNGRRAQLWFGDTPSSGGGGVYWRPRQGDSVGYWGWERFLTSSNYNDYAPTKTGGGASGTWGISISGNSATTSQTSFSSLSTSGLFQAANTIKNNFSGVAHWDINFGNASNQKVNIEFDPILWGYFEIHATCGYNYANRPGLVKKGYYVGLNPGGAIYLNESRVIDSHGYTGSGITFSDITWTGSKYRIVASNRDNAANRYSIKIVCFAETGDVRDRILGATFSSVYTSDSTSYGYPYPYYNQAVGFGGKTDPAYAVDVTGVIRAQQSNGPVAIFTKTGSSPGNNMTLKVVNTYGNHSWGITGEFRIEANGGTDRPSILFSTGYNNDTWSVGFGSTDSNFRINRDHGYVNQSWGTTLMVMDRSGNVTFTGDVTAYSDIRLKTDINKIENAIEKISKINGVTFKRIDDIEDNVGRIHAGVIAQEVLEVLPEVVSKNTSGYYQVAYGNMVGLLIEAIKEQQNQIEELKSQIKNK